MGTWTHYDWPAVQALATGPAPWQVAAERTCPVCGAKAVRFYLHGSTRRGHPTVITYVWCGNCHRYDGSTGPRTAGFDFTDPVPPERHDEFTDDLAGLLEFLDRLWDERRLPQTVTQR